MSPPIKATFLLEQTLGHVTHSDNLMSLVGRSAHFEPTFVPVPFEVEGVARFIPGYRNWTVRAGLRARRSIRSVDRNIGIDALFVHSQVPAVLATRWLRRIPSVVSLDATPRQYDEMGVQYGHARSNDAVERLKWHANRRSLAAARQVVAWSQWAKAGIVDDYGIEPDGITVVPPGVDVATWGAPARSHSRSGPVRILFVGGDLDRKGGDVLLAAFEEVRCRSDHVEIELHLVTRGLVPNARRGVVVHSDMTPNSDALIRLYHECDIFCLPTFGDCLPLVLAEAAAGSMPLVATDVGAIGELVRHGDTGMLVQPGDASGLADVLADLVADPRLRTRLGENAHSLAVREHDARQNAQRLVDLLLHVANGGAVR